MRLHRHYSCEDAPKRAGGSGDLTHARTYAGSVPLALHKRLAFPESS